MNCELFRTFVHPWLDDSLDASAASTLERHAGSCAGCCAALAAERRLRSALRQLPVPPARPAFAVEAMRVARVADRSWQRQLRRHDMRIAAVAAAAALGALAFAQLRDRPGVFEPAAAMTSSDVPVYALTAGQAQSLRLRIEAPRDFQGVRFSVELPDHVFLVGQPGIRAMTWEGSLRKGPNVLELPLLAQAGAAGRVATRVTWGDFEQLLETSLVSVPPVSGEPVRPQDSEV